MAVVMFVHIHTLGDRDTGISLCLMASPPHRRPQLLMRPRGGWSAGHDAMAILKLLEPNEIKFIFTPLSRLKQNKPIEKKGKSGEQKGEKGVIITKSGRRGWFAFSDCPLCGHSKGKLIWWMERFSWPIPSFSARHSIGSKGDFFYPSPHKTC